MINCSLFAKNLESIDSSFKAGDPPAIVIADTSKLVAAMEATDAYYVNTAKIKFHAEQLAKDRFELPLITIRAGKIVWIEGFHQITPAEAADLPLIPIQSVSSLVPQLIQLVGAPAGRQAQAVAKAKQLYDFAACAGFAIN
ncbi:MULTISPECIES: hypothetical protein [unclassified Paraburkholderia]|uniref:hypothetical protein n=1 Tax=unclassified Paraburkholderia TaxID=2615204 RepID=UPI001622B9E5|nr:MULTISPECIES: hypothetical protein [unclassified Paraburkholderia]MBB5448412.1 hypothetical protein [Paraburkholderia sp. WSM4177]MBB5488792.1 hypothetical protein [Paraburkholderia sp. WSM4180]